MPTPARQRGGHTGGTLDRARRFPPLGGGLAGHIATVRAVQGDRYEVVEQNFLDFNPNLEPRRQTFDLRSVAWPDPAVIGFVVAPAVG